MIDPLLSLSFNLHAQKGTYALLLGSGVSRDASIPTGWEVTLDLVSKLAHLQEENCKGDEVNWYKNKYGKDPIYSELLSSIAATSAAQQQLLKAYFEASNEEKEEGKKLPTVAHKAIAKLVGLGYIRVIVTTNFDRLLESALEAEGIAPVVIASTDAASGAPPLVHTACTVVKVHGDYLDHRIRNSPEALSTYDEPVNRLLDQIFDEYGLITCGWSAEYDVALSGALKRSKSRRYPMYWTGISGPSTVAKDIISLYKGNFINIHAANEFFVSLLSKVEALEEFNRPHPISIQLAVATLKRYLSEDKYRIQLHDLLVNEAEITANNIESVFFEFKATAPSSETAPKLMQRLEGCCEQLVQLFANGAFFVKQEQVKPFFEAFNLVVAKSQEVDGYNIWSKLRKYPALLLIYATGMVAIISENHSLLRELATRQCYIKRDGASVSAVSCIDVNSMMSVHEGRQLLLGMDRHHSPTNDYLDKVLREPLRKLLPDDTRYKQIFDDFEYLWCLLHFDAELQRGAQSVFTPWGAFCWRRMKNRNGHEWLMTRIEKAVSQSDKLFYLLQAGLFGGSIERLAAAFNRAQPSLKNISDGMY